jgi:heme/copper-type cytochrome/quinol oxidase subunit 2
MGLLNNLLMVNQFGRDVPEPWQLSLQDAAHPVMEEIIFFHDQVMFILTIIIVTVLWLIVKALSGKAYHRYLVDGTLLEIV